MATTTTHPPTAADSDSEPIDIGRMRKTARRLLGPDDGPDYLPPAMTELDPLTDALREHLQALMPQVEQLATAKKKTIAQYCALGCVGEARRKLSIQPDPDLRSRTFHLRKLARVLDALCNHYEQLSTEAP